LPAEEVEILAAKGLSCTLSSLAPSQHEVSSSAVLDGFKDDLQVLHSEETLAGLKAACSFSQGRLVSFYMIWSKSFQEMHVHSGFFFFFNRKPPSSLI